jgi:hypothetical protein
MVSINPSIFEYDYKKMKENNKYLHEELIKKLFHPSRISYYLSIGYDLDDL